jgi:competence protein ComEA
MGGVISWLEQHQLLLVAVAAVVLAGAVGVRAVSDASSSPQLALRDGSGLPDGALIRVHVTGAVLRSGVFTLREGDRVADALTAAGGPANDAALEELNLARRVRDGEQVAVPKSKTKGAVAPVATLAAGTKLDINTATEQQLDLLPGIGATYARRIVDSRAVDGPYRTTQDLLNRKVLPKATFDKVSALITAGQ